VLCLILLWVEMKITRYIATVSVIVFTAKTNRVIYFQYRSMRKSFTVVDICGWETEIIWKKGLKLVHQNNSLFRRRKLQIYIYKHTWGAQWLRHYTTNRQVADSIPDGVIGIFHNPSRRTMVLGSTQLLIEMSTRCISWGWRRPVRKADNLTTILCRCHDIWEP